MKIIFSRKGFDAENGGTASPVMPDGTMLSLPIPQNDATPYDSVFFNGKSYMDIWKELKPNQQDFFPYCHLDPDLRNTHKRDDWKPIFGQAGAAQTHLENQGVTIGDIFVFFGWFRQTENVDGKLIYLKGAKDAHMMFGYLQIGEIVKGKDVLAYPWHPHSNYCIPDLDIGNTMYIASEKLVIDGEDTGLPGAGTFRYSDKIVLTMPGQTKSRWQLPDFFKSVTISCHNADSFKPEGYFQTVRIGQEFVVSESQEVTDWIKDIIISHVDLRDSQQDDVKKLKNRMNKYEIAIIEKLNAFAKRKESDKDIFVPTEVAEGVYNINTYAFNSIMDNRITFGLEEYDEPDITTTIQFSKNKVISSYALCTVSDKYTNIYYQYAEALKFRHKEELFVKPIEGGVILRSSIRYTQESDDWYEKLLKSLEDNNVMLDFYNNIVFYPCRRLMHHIINIKDVILEKKTFAEIFSFASAQAEAREKSTASTNASTKDIALKKPEDTVKSRNIYSTRRSYDATTFAAMCVRYVRNKEDLPTSLTYNAERQTNEVVTDSGESISFDREKEPEKKHALTENEIQIIRKLNDYIKESPDDEDFLVAEYFDEKTYVIPTFPFYSIINNDEDDSWKDYRGPEINTRILLVDGEEIVSEASCTVNLNPQMIEIVRAYANKTVELGNDLIIEESGNQITFYRYCVISGEDNWEAELNKNLSNEELQSTTWYLLVISPCTRLMNDIMVLDDIFTGKSTLEETFSWMELSLSDEDIEDNYDEDMADDPEEDQASTIELINASCVDQDVDVVVNAANNRLMSGGGVCGAIFDKAGVVELSAACNKYKTPLADGEAVITPAYNISNAFAIIHAVGPNFGITPNAFKELFAAYYNSLELMKDFGYHSISFPLISSGIYAGTLKNPVTDSIKQCCRAYNKFIDKYPEYIISVKVCVYNPSEMEEAQEEFYKNIM